jgi:hypothetical protein
LRPWRGPFARSGCRRSPRAPTRCKGLAGWPLGCCIVSLMFFSRTEGYAWALVIPFGPYCGLLDFEETILWVRASALAGCSPRGLGEMSYLFKGFEFKQVGPLGEDKGSCRAVAVVTLRVAMRGKVGGSCSIGYLSTPIASPWRGGV